MSVVFCVNELTLWLPQVTSNPRSLRQSCDTTIVSFVVRIFPLPRCNINQLIYVKKVTSLSLCHVNYNQCNFQQTRLLTFNTCLVMLCLLVHFLDHFWMTSILFDVDMYCRFFFCIQVSKLGHQWPSGTEKFEKLKIFSRSSLPCKLDYVFSFVKK